MIKLYNKDCMIDLKNMKDNQYSLSIIDCPYGIGEDGSKGTRTSPSRPNSYHRKPKYKANQWDKSSPKILYFNQLIRISKNQIIWGANHFISKIPFDSSCWIVWDKNNKGTDFADCELAWTSFKTTIRKFFGHKFIGTNGGKDCIHPCQKPVALYKWLLKNYGFNKDGSKRTILDTHFGSLSIGLACADMGFDLDAWEIDSDYFNAAVNRLHNHINQLNAFTERPEVMVNGIPIDQWMNKLKGKYCSE